jgi:serine/threonine protein kinase
MPTPDQNDAPLDGRFRVHEAIGHGAMSDVYRATDERLGRDVAVKILRSGAPDPERFAEETALLCSLDHPHLVRLHDAGEYDGAPFLVLNLMAGTLAQRLADGPLPPDGGVRLGAEIASALEYLHARGIVHRDIKPSNILLAEDGSACLADLGAALTLDGARLTATGLTIGTPRYLAPEQASGQEVGPPADVYSLGLVLIEAIAGAPAFTGTNDEVIVARVTRSPEVPSGLADALSSSLQSMVAVDPALRPSAGEVRAALASVSPTDLAVPPDGSAVTAVLAPPTMVFDTAAASAAAASTSEPAAGPAMWFREDRSRALWVGLAALLLVAALAGLASADGGPAVPSRVVASTTVPTTVTTVAPTTTTLPATTVAVAPVGPNGGKAGPKEHGKKH